MNHWAAKSATHNMCLAVGQQEAGHTSCQPLLHRRPTSLRTPLPPRHLYQLTEVPSSLRPHRRFLELRKRDWGSQGRGRSAPPPCSPPPALAKTPAVKSPSPAGGLQVSPVTWRPSAHTCSLCRPPNPLRRLPTAGAQMSHVIPAGPGPRGGHGQFQHGHSLTYF